jgi:hypothetical protein
VAIGSARTGIAHGRYQHQLSIIFTAALGSLNLFHGVIVVGDPRAGGSQHKVSESSSDVVGVLISKSRSEIDSGSSLLKIQDGFFELHG